MSVQSPINVARVCREVSTTAGKLKVVANFMNADEGEDDWELSIVNERDAAQIWMEWFPTAEAAIAAGLAAIEEEGPEAFVKNEDSILEQLMRDAAMAGSRPR